MMKTVRGARTAMMLGLLLLVVVAPVRAASDRPLELRYGLYWGGLRLATLALRHEIEPQGYATETSIETVGLLAPIVRYRGQMQVTGARSPSGELAPSTYRAASERRSKTRTTVLRFDPQTGQVAELEMTKRGEPDRSNVPQALRRDAVDPLTALLRVRDWAARARLGGREPFRAAVFDGRRRYDVEATLHGEEHVLLMGRDWRALRLEVALVPVAGFDEDDLKHTAADQDGLRLEVLLSDDRRLLPLRVQTLDATITGAAQLLEDCSAEPGCQLAAR